MPLLPTTESHEASPVMNWGSSTKVRVGQAQVALKARSYPVKSRPGRAGGSNTPPAPGVSDHAPQAPAPELPKGGDTPLPACVPSDAYANAAREDNCASAQLVFAPDGRASLQRWNSPSFCLPAGAPPGNGETAWGDKSVAVRVTRLDESACREFVAKPGVSYALPDDGTHSVSPPAAEGPTSTAITGAQGPSRWRRGGSSPAPFERRGARGRRRGERRCRSADLSG